MIKSLTKEQEARFPELVKKWTDIGLNTDRANRTEAEHWCYEAYKVAELDPPKIILWAESPLGLLVTAKLIKELSKKGYDPYKNISIASVRDSVRDSVWDSVRTSVWDSVGASVGNSVGASVRDSVRDSVWDSVRTSVWASVMNSVWDSVGASVVASIRNSVVASVMNSVWDSVGASVWASALKEELSECNSWGQHDANIWSFYDYFRIVCGLKEQTEKLLPLMNLSHHTGWHIFYKEVAILSEKPTNINFNSIGQLHNFNGPAIRWNDGYELYRFNGVRLDGKEQYASMKNEEFTKDIILKEENADIRREIIKKIGINKTIELLGADIIDTYESNVGGKYELLSIDYDGRGKRNFLKMKNPSLDETYHIEGVPNECVTVKKALAYRLGQEEYIEPEVIT